jgi:two-component sensor histidine kinase/sensor domain CHASE-containing protein
MEYGTATDIPSQSDRWRSSPREWPAALQRRLGLLAGQPRRAYLLLPILLFVLLMMLTLVLWQHQAQQELLRIESDRRLIEQRLAGHLEAIITAWISPLERLRAGWLVGRSDADWDRLASIALVHTDLPMLETVVWIDEDDRVLRLFPAGIGSTQVGADLGEDPLWAPALQRARASSSQAMGPIGPRGLARAVLPVVSAGPEGMSYQGAIGATLDIDAVLEEAAKPEKWQLHAWLQDGSGQFITTDDAAAPQQRRPAEAAGTPVQFMEAQWWLRLEPTLAFIDARRSAAPYGSLVGGTLISVLMSSVVFQKLRHHWQENQQSQRHLEALESLTRLSTSISGNLGAGQEVLDQLADAARQLLGMEMSVVAVANERAGRVEPVAMRGFNGDVPESTLLEDAPLSAAALAGRNLLAIDDVLKSEVPVNSAALARFSVRSLLVIPLEIEGRPFGLLVLADVQPRKFTGPDLHLARLLGSQAAVILANHRLYEQMNSALEAQQRLIVQRESLFSVNAAIYQASTLEETFRRIVELAPAALGIDLCGLVLKTSNEDELVIAAATPAFNELAGDLIRRPTERVKRALASGEPLIIPDAQRDRSLHPAWEKVPGAGSIGMIPLYRGDRSVLGLLVLVRYERGGFSDEQMSLVRMFTARATAAIENAELHHQTRRDAEAKAMLLRELNHRVKNSLTGIVGLLSIDKPELSQAARHWVDRVVERIRTMARAHDLFSGGLNAVSLRELVMQVLPSLTAIKPPQVQVLTDLGVDDVSLSTDKAVSLAMVLYELGYNAIVHGVKERGTVSIRARYGGQFVVIEVSDDGHGCGPETAAEGTARPEGLGLKLVSGLTGRELNGTFTLRGRKDGGTVATVQFPLKGNRVQEQQ